jgi:hypothetical protein
LSRTASAATVVAIAAAAFVADLAHEAVGHGGACALLGGQVVYVSSTFADCSIRSALIDGAGPGAGIGAALLFWLWLRLVPPASAATRAFLCLGFAFAAFWNFGYLIKSGLTDDGDWAFVIAGLEPHALWRAGITLVGIATYWISIRMLARMMLRHLAAGDGPGPTPSTISLVAYVSATAIACLAAAFDPRGPFAIVHDALPASLGAIGLPLAGRALTHRGTSLHIAASPAWIAAGVVAAAGFVFLLGRGVHF